MRLAFISDIHEDVESLRRILRKAEKRGYDQLICLGDISGFSLPFYTYGKKRDAAASLQLIRQKCDWIIPGNHDMHAARRIPKHSDVFSFPKNWYDLPPQTQAGLSAESLWLHDDEPDTNYSTDDLEFLKALPEFAILETPECRILLSHYAFPNLSGFKKGFYSWEKDFSAHFEFMQKHNCQLGFTGHAHPLGFYLVWQDRFRQYGYRGINISRFPAVVGVPPVTRHKHRRGFCIFDTHNKHLKIYR
jgi:predicted phosphodiesterase